MEDMLREILREEIRKGEHWRKRRQSERQPVWGQYSRERERGVKVRHGKRTRKKTREGREGECEVE